MKASSVEFHMTEKELEYQRSCSSNTFFIARIWAAFIVKAEQEWTMSVKKEIPDIFKGFVFLKHLFRDPALCVLGTVLILGQIFCRVLPKGKGGVLGLAQCIPGSTEPLKGKARAWKCCGILLWGCCHVFLSSWISGLIVFVSVNLILCLRFIPAGVYPIEKGFVWFCCQFFYWFANPFQGH